MRISDWSSDMCSSDLRSKGTRERVVLFKNALKNAASPVVTILSFQIAFMLGGSAIVEQIFGLPGMGSLRSEEHTSELQSLMRISYAVFCLKKKTITYRR